MVVRHHQIDFASGALVFPGGKVDDGDFGAEVAARCDGASSDPTMRALQVAAIREAFEECGVLLARKEGSPALIGVDTLAPLERFRAKLVDGSVSLAAFLSDHQLRLACDTLVHFAHWVTPEMMPKRFDTHFFLADAPRDQIALHDGYESVDSVWIRPDDALAGARNGRYTVIFPTLRNLEKLGQSASPTAAMSLAKESQVVSVTPWTERRTDGTYLCIPKDAGYDHCEEKMPERRQSAPG